jgi:pyruvate dehydrogenase E2 component (dihydrolipoamide acetyltransferase)
MGVKKYFNLGIAMDTPNGLVVPVVKDVEQKSLVELATELAQTSAKARDGKLSPKDKEPPSHLAYPSRYLD